MATSYMTAAQVGSYFVTQYYSMLQQRPEFVHQLYSDASTMLRIDGHTREAATAMLQIHALVMSMRFTSIEIKTAHSLESWNGGVIVMVTGSAQMSDLNGRKKFGQTFFLAPQEKSFFVLNDIFHFIEDDQIHPYSASLVRQSNLNSKLTAAPPIPEAATCCQSTVCTICFACVFYKQDFASCFRVAAVATRKYSAICCPTSTVQFNTGCK